MREEVLKKFFDKFHNNNHSSYIFFLFRNVVLNLVYVVGLKVFPKKPWNGPFYYM